MHSFSRTIFLTFACLTVSSAAFGQTARFSGQVTDAQNAAITNAEVEVINLTTLDKAVAKTDNAGFYVVPYLPAGQYRFQLNVPGFAPYTSAPLGLGVGQAYIYNVQLTVGSAESTVQVTGSSEVTQVNTQSAEISGTITGKEVAGIQLNGRNYTQLIALTPGVSNQTQQDEAKVGVLGSVAYSVNGGRTEYNSFQVDGSETLNVGINKDHSTLVVYPSVDAIQEIKVLTSNYGAQYPSTGNGTTIVTTKSGTDQLHGNLYEFLRNEDLNAKGYFDVTNGPPLYRRNDFGGTVGGPIVIPKFYDGRGKTHFFFSEEARLEKSPTAYRQAVPSLQEQNGDFSDVCPGADCPLIPTYTALSGHSTLLPNHVPVAAAATAILNTGLIPSPNARTGCTSTIESCYIADVSLPTYFREELFRIDHAIGDTTQASFRYIHDEWDATTPIPNYSYVTNSFPTIQNRFYGPGISLAARLTHTFSATLLNEFVASYTNSHITLADVPGTNIALTRPNALNAAVCPVTAQLSDYPDCGLGQIFPYSGSKIPGIVIGGNNRAYGGAGFTVDPSYMPWSHNNPTYSFADNVTKVIGPHNLSFGGQWVIFQRNQTNGPIGAATGDVQGLLTFSNEQSAYTSGNAFADFVSMGGISTYQQDSGQARYYQRYQIFEPYFQDDWKVNSRLTVNAGLRVSLFGVYHEKNHDAYNWESSAFSRAVGESVQVDPGQPYAGTSIIRPSTGQLLDSANGTAIPIYQKDGKTPDSRLTNGIVQCGVQGRPDGCMTGHLNNFAPRVGLAWDPFGNGKNSIRAGYGIFYEHGTADEANTGSLEGSAPKVLSMLQRNISNLNCIGNTAAGCSPLGPGAFPLNVTAIPTKAIWPYIQQWSFSVQRELPKSTLFSLAFVGSKGTHLTAQREINQLKPTPPSLNPYGAHQPMTASTRFAVGPKGDCNIGGPNQAPIPPENSASINFQVACNGYNGGSGQDPNSFRQYAPGLGEIFSLENIANSQYDAFQVYLRHISGPLTLGAAYTWSHSLDDASDRSDATFTDSYNLKSAWASSNFDQRHLLHISYIDQLPLRQALQKILQNLNTDPDPASDAVNPSASEFLTSRLAKKALDGWQLSGITLFETGIPFTVINNGSPAINSVSPDNNQVTEVFPGVSVNDNAGVANGVGAAAYPDLVGKIHGAHAKTAGNTFGPILLNPGAFAAPRGLTFGNAGRNVLNNPQRWNFDTALGKTFSVHEAVNLEFRAEAFNVFNHTQFRIYNPTLGNQPQNQISCYAPTPPYTADYAGSSTAGDAGCLTGTSFLHPIDAHRPRTIQFGLKLAF